MSILRLFNASGDDPGERRSRAWFRSTQRRAWSLSLCSLASCTSFASLDDSAQPAEPVEPPMESNGAGGRGSTPQPEPTAPESGTPNPPDAPVGPVGGGPIGTPPPATGAAPSFPLDAGPSPAVGGADAGLPDQGSPEPPGTVTVPECMGGVALTLDGASYASVLRAVENDFTLEAWIKTSVSPMGSGAFNGRLLFDNDIVGMGPRDDFAVSIVNDRLAFGVGNPDTSLQGLRVVATGQWEHVAVTRRVSNGQLQVIINGELQAVGASANRNPLSARPDLALGGFSGMNKFIGAIDEVKFWNVVRSVQDITASMRQRPTGLEEGLVGYYSFEDQGIAQTADGSPLGLDATLIGNPLYEPSSALCPPAP